MASELEHGFKQAGVIILKLIRSDTGRFKDALEYLLRNSISCGDILLINKFGKTLEIQEKDLRTGFYKKKAKGFL